jgi:hypothetical protein
MQKNESIARSEKRTASLVITSSVKRSAPWIALVVLLLTIVSGCSYLKPNLTAAELSKGLGQ